MSCESRGLRPVKMSLLVWAGYAVKPYIDPRRGTAIKLTSVMDKRFSLLQRSAACPRNPAILQRFSGSCGQAAGSRLEIRLNLMACALPLEHRRRINVDQNTQGRLHKLNRQWGCWI
jgi:hypothetical protein